MTAPRGEGGGWGGGRGDGRRGPAGPGTYNPHYGEEATTYTPRPYAAGWAEPAGRPRITFSLLEVRHLAASVLLLTLAFAWVLDEEVRFPRDLVPRPAILLGAFLALLSGFVLHELAHKVVAQRYGHWAEFRAFFSGLLLALALSAALKFFVALPGAVMIRGRVTLRENGIISLVGPGVNLLIALAALPFTFATNGEAPLPVAMGTVSQVNAILCLFNLVPVGVLDGRKVLRWSKVAWGIAIALAVVVVVLVFLNA